MNVNKVCFPSTTGSSAIPKLWSREEGKFEYQKYASKTRCVMETRTLSVTNFAT